MRPAIPLIDPTIVQQIANQKHHGDTEKVATTTVRPFFYRGVELSSRYDKAAEYEVMLDLVDSFDEIDIQAIQSVFCDSKSDTYCISFGSCNLNLAKHISKKIECFFDFNCIWHNGIYIQGKAGGSIFLTAAIDEDIFLNA